MFHVSRISIFGHKAHTSVPGTKPINGCYPVCKFAVTALTECLRQEMIYLESQTKVTSISPGLVENDILTTDGCDNNEIVKYMPRLKPADVAKAVSFIISMPDNVLVSNLPVIFLFVY